VNLSIRILGILVLFLFASTLCDCAQTTKGGPEPSWVFDLYTVYARDCYIAVVGEAPNRAEVEALKRLDSILGSQRKTPISSEN